MKKSYLGIHVHKEWCVFTEIDSTGELLRQERFGNAFEGVSTFASSRVNAGRIAYQVGD